MPTISWTNGLDTGHPIIDHQHREIVALLNEIIGSFESDRHKHVEEACEKLRRLLAAHFEFETDLLKQIDFPGASLHGKAHNESLEAVQRLIQKCGRSCRRGMPSECAAEWCYLVVDHLVRADLEFKSFLQEHS
jgi:hemerythrin